MMEILVGTSLIGHIKQDQFFVQLLRNGKAEEEYRGKFETGSWEFNLYREGSVVLDCQRISEISAPKLALADKG